MKKVFLISLASLALQMVASQEGLVTFYRGEACSGGFAISYPDDDGCSHQEENELYYSIEYDRGLGDVGRLLAYSGTVQEFCAHVITSSDGRCVSSGDHPTIQGAKWEESNVDPCGKRPPYICRLDSHKRLNGTVDSKHFHGWQGYKDSASGIKYLIDPKTINMDDLKQAIQGEQELEFFERNFTFKFRKEDELNMSKWVHGNRTL